MDGDTFMRTDSRVDKWLILELPQVIRPDTLRVRTACTQTQSADLSQLSTCMQGPQALLQTCAGAPSRLPSCLRPQVSQHELYSARIRDFEVRGRQKHPRHDSAAAGEPGKSIDYGRSLNNTAWKLVGNFTAAKVKGTQSFKVSGVSCPTGQDTGS